MLSTALAGPNPVVLPLYVLLCWTEALYWIKSTAINKNIFSDISLPICQSVCLRLKESHCGDYCLRVRVVKGNADRELSRRAFCVWNKLLQNSIDGKLFKLIYAWYMFKTKWTCITLNGCFYFKVISIIACRWYVYLCRIAKRLTTYTRCDTF